MDKVHKSRTKRQAHDYVLENIGGQTVKIDVGILPVIRWLNRFPSVTTEYCCQGDKDELNKRPYVLFYCHSLEDLESIALTFEVYEDWMRTQKKSSSGEKVFFFAPSIKVDTATGAVRYLTKWKDSAHLKSFVKWLEQTR